MATRGRPAKVLSIQDLTELEKFLTNLDYLKKNQKQATSLLHSKEFYELDEKDLSFLKVVHREKIQFEQRQSLIAQIQLKQRNQQHLLANEIEILQLLEKDQDQDTFFRLDRALESYQKIEKAALDNRIRLENEHKRDILNKTNKELTEAQKKRNAENQLKYALGGIVLSIWKNFKFEISPNNLKSIESRINNSLLYHTKIRKSALYQEAFAMTQDHLKASKLFFLALEKLPTFNMNQEEFHKALLKKVYKPQ
ncbi:hypothetical protein [Acinetobacter sp. TSRC1-2]|uniref:hypothetical protein n=1 Tax=unclassified Acinetobacter TaxID=196816 RepID=UPI003CECD5E3